MTINRWSLLALWGAITPTSPTVWARVKDRFAPVKMFFSVKDFGGWAQVNKAFFSNGGSWNRLFAQTC